MAKLEGLKPGIKVKGLIPQQAVTIVDVVHHGSSAVEIIYKRSDGATGNQLLYRSDESKLKIIETQNTWDFNTDGDTFRLAAEAYRIHLAHLFDPVLAVHTSLIEPLPHQITAVYGEMLSRQPLRFLLADDPGAGKTIMAGLLIKELIVRGDVQRCLICAPGCRLPSPSLSMSGAEKCQLKSSTKIFEMQSKMKTRGQSRVRMRGNP